MKDKHDLKWPSYLWRKRKSHGR